MRNINTLILFFLISSQLSFSQDYGVSTDDLFSGGNVLLRKLMKKDFSEAEGSPYLDKNFRNGKIIFNNGKIIFILISVQYDVEVGV